MASFLPFRALTYNTDRAGPLDALIAPPYDIISSPQRRVLAERSAYNAVHVEAPVADNADPYAGAAERFRDWQSAGILDADDDPTYWVYRMGYQDEAGRARQTSGVFGALEVGANDVLPHEETTPKALGDRLDLLRATRMNTSPIWGLSLASGFSALCDPVGAPEFRATDDDGVHHRLWRVTQPGVRQTIAEAIASSPVVIADGHHRLETARAYLAEHPEDRAATHMLAYIVELAEEQLSVQAIHRLIDNVDHHTDLIEALARHFELFETAPPDESIIRRMDDAGALGVITPAGTWLAKPSLALNSAVDRPLDSARLRYALADIADLKISYQHGWDNANSAVQAHEAQAAVLLRPPSVAQIASVAHAHDRMPPKSTYFRPKPRTGMVFRSLDL